MRFLGRLLLLVLVMASLLAGGHWLWHSLQWSDLAAVLGGRIENALPSSAYGAVAGRWLEFPLTADAGALRVRSNATADIDTPSDPGVVWRYAFEFELLDRNGNVLHQGIYHHRTRISRFLDPLSGRTLTRSFLLDPSTVPMDGRSMRLTLDATTRAALLRLRPTRQDPAVKGVLFRVYEQLRNPPGQLGYLWQRLGETQRVRLARASVYGPDLLREEEKHNLLKRQWQAIGPLGVAGQNYAVERLYVAHESGGGAVDDGVMPQGLYADPVARATIPLPEGEWGVRLQLAPLGADPPATGQRDVTVRWYGRELGQRREERIAALPADHRLRARVEGGLLELIPASPLVVRAWVENAEGELEVTPLPRRLRTFRSGPSDPLFFDVEHVGASPTPLRLDIRALFASGEDTGSFRAGYQMLDAAGSELARGDLAAQVPVSNYDRSARPEAGVRVSEPARFFFYLPPEVATLRVFGTEDLLFAAYSRPADLAHRIRIPEDYQALAPDDLKQPGWFVLLPRDERRLRVSLRSETLVIQPRPPEDDPRLLAGQYDWVLYQPKGDWRARYLLAPRGDGLPLRDQSRAAVFHELTPGEESAHRFVGSPVRRSIEPLLVYTRDDAEPMHVTIDVDGEPWFSSRVSGASGEVRLPPLAPGPHSLRLEAARPARWFLNHIDAEGQAFLRRISMKLDAEGLDFIYPKQSAGAEVLTGEFYTGADERVRLHVNIEPLAPPSRGPLTDWTFTERIFDVRPEVAQELPVLGAGGETVNGGQRLFIPLGAGMPAGDYRIRVRSEGEAGGYLTLYRLIPGQPVTRAFLREAYALN